MFACLIALVLCCLVLPPAVTAAGAEAIIADHVAVSRFEEIPEAVIESVSTQYTVFYGHTSHGSQIVTGLNQLYAENTLYQKPLFHEISDDLGHNGDTSWVAPTRTWLDAHPEYNVAMWSWCGGCSDNTEAGIDIYLNAMEGLEAEYPNVLFIYMTGHLDGTGVEGNLYARNNQIRAYCQAHDKILFDFADIESWDPDGNYYPDESDYCNWCTSWCGNHECPSCACAHSQCFNCYLKGKGFWAMMAEVWGWDPATSVAGETSAPAPFRLEPNRPNPFNPSTEISFVLVEPSRARIDVFDASGRLVATPLDRDLPAGGQSILWKGEDRSGRSLPAGVYFYRLRAGGFERVRKMTLIK
ncbi:MAG: T9SS type A sorting domain-containing protein [Candidatus Eisenbacteria bacterium]|nr:T9SS type A sorting domain-containing protein [Candidatus Eisenbacteria bacterium]